MPRRFTRLVLSYSTTLPSNVKPYEASRHCSDRHDHSARPVYSLVRAGVEGCARVERGLPEWHRLGAARSIEASAVYPLRVVQATYSSNYQAPQSSLPAPRQACAAPRRRFERGNCEWRRVCSATSPGRFSCQVDPPSSVDAVISVRFANQGVIMKIPSRPHRYQQEQGAIGYILMWVSRSTGVGPVSHLPSPGLHLGFFAATRRGNARTLSGYPPATSGCGGIAAEEGEHFAGDVARVRSDASPS
jgi:hypothetical protein